MGKNGSPFQGEFSISIDNAKLDSRFSARSKVTPLLLAKTDDQMKGDEA